MAGTWAALEATSILITSNRDPVHKGNGFACERGTRALIRQDRSSADLSPDPGLMAVVFHLKSCPFSAWPG